MSLFVGTGLARSRTGWLSNFLDVSPVECIHDLSRRATSEEDYFLRLSEPTVATIDTGANLVPGLIEATRNVPWLLIARDPLDAIESAMSIGFSRDVASWAAERSLAFMHRVQDECENVLCVKFEDLSSESTGRKIWTHCIGPSEFPSDRFHRLAAMRIDLEPSAFRVSEWLVGRAKEAA